MPKSIACFLVGALLLAGAGGGLAQSGGSISEFQYLSPGSFPDTLRTRFMALGDRLEKPGNERMHRRLIPSFVRTIYGGIEG